MSLDPNKIIPRKCNRIRYKYLSKADNILRLVIKIFSIVFAVMELILIRNFLAAEYTIYDDILFIFFLVSSVTIYSIFIISFVIIQKLVIKYSLNHSEKHYGGPVYDVDFFNVSGEFKFTLFVQETINYKYYREYATGKLIPRAITYIDGDETYHFGYETPIHSVSKYELVIADKSNNIIRMSDNRVKVDDTDELTEYIEDILAEYGRIYKFRRYLDKLIIYPNK